MFRIYIIYIILTITILDFDIKKEMLFFKDFKDILHSDVSVCILQYVDTRDFLSLKSIFHDIPCIRENIVYHLFWSGLTKKSKSLFQQQFCQDNDKYMRLMLEFPFHEIYGFVNMAYIVNELTQKSEITRKQNILYQLHKYYVPLRDDSSFGYAFVNGYTLASIDEVVNMIRLTNFLFSWGYHTWYMFHGVLEKKMYDYCIYYNVDWYEAYSNIVYSKDILFTINDFHMRNFV